MRLKSFLIIGIALLSLAGCKGGDAAATGTPAAGGAATPAATASKAP